MPVEAPVTSAVRGWEVPLIDLLPRGPAAGRERVGRLGAHPADLFRGFRRPVRARPAAAPQAFTAQGAGGPRCVSDGYSSLWHGRRRPEPGPPRSAPPRARSTPRPPLLSGLGPAAETRPCRRAALRSPARGARPDRSRGAPRPALLSRAAAQRNTVAAPGGDAGSPARGGRGAAGRPRIGAGPAGMLRPADPPPVGRSEAAERTGEAPPAVLPAAGRPSRTGRRAVRVLEQNPVRLSGPPRRAPPPKGAGTPMRPSQETLEFIEFMTRSGPRIDSGLPAAELRAALQERRTSPAGPEVALVRGAEA